MILIDVEPLYKQYVELEKQARECQMDYLDHCKADSPNVIKWSAILTERTAYKYDLQDAPKVDAVPVVRCKDCKYQIKKKYWSDEGIYFRGWCSVFNILVATGDNGYCSRGERRDGDETNTD